MIITSAIKIVCKYDNKCGNNDKNKYLNEYENLYENKYEYGHNNNSKCENEYEIKDEKLFYVKINERSHIFIYST